VTRPGIRPLVTEAAPPQLALDDYIGIRTSTFRFRLFNGVTGENLGDITPYISNPQLSHDTSRTVKRTLSLDLGVEDSSAINPITDRIDVSMIVEGLDEFPLGRYMFTDSLQQVSTGGNRASVQLVDEMFIINQPMDTPYSTFRTNVPDDSSGLTPGDEAILDLLAGYDFKVRLEGVQAFASAQAAIGADRSQVINSIAQQCGYFSPWMDNENFFHVIRTFDPETVVPQFDYDTRHAVYVDSISTSTDIITAPNRFIVLDNGSSSGTLPIVGTYDVPPSAPYSIAQRGFVIPKIVTMQVPTEVQATAVATALGVQNSVTEQIQFSTPPDPRHDSYDVCLLQGQLWLERSWSMTLVEGASMQHTCTRFYR